MNWQTIATNVGLPLVGVGGVGGVGAAISWFVKSLVKQEFQQQLESHKTKLRKSEFLFQKEFEAASAFISLNRRLMSKIHRFPGMDLSDFYRDFALSFSEVEEELEAYIVIHGAALQEETLEHLNAAICIASLDVTDEESWQQFDHSYEVPEKLENDAESLIKILGRIQQKLYQSVRLQSDI